MGLQSVEVLIEIPKAAAVYARVNDDSMA